MSDTTTTTQQTSAVKVVKSWRLHPDIVKAIEDGNETHEYPNETAYVEAIFRRVFGLPDPPRSKPPRVGKRAMALRA